MVFQFFLKASGTEDLNAVTSELAKYNREKN